MTKYPERNQEVDVVRGIAILLVMLGHAIQCSNGMRPTHPLQQLIMTFWMPLFFLISGYAHGMTGGGRLSRKVRRLLVPYFLWALFVYGCNVWMGRTALGFVDCVNGLLHSGFWFLRMLFEIWFVSYAFQEVKKRWGWVWGGVGSMVVLGFEYFIIGEQSVIHYLPLYVIGIILYFVQRYIPKKMVNASLLVSPVAFGIMAILYLNFSGKTVNRLLDVAMAFVGSLMAFAFARLICRFSAGSFLKSGFVWAGVASLELYAIHWCLLFNTSFIILPWPVLLSVWLCLSVVIILVYRLLRSKLIVMIRGDMCADWEARKR